MAYMTIHRISGDADDLLRRKEARMDPAIRRRAGEYGAIFSVTTVTPEGLVVVNLWDSPDGAQTFTALSEIQEANKMSGLPPPASFERYERAYAEFYRPVPRTTTA